MTTSVPTVAPRVLIVDDAVDNREMYATFFEYSGFRVAQAENAGDALEQLAREPADVVITDVSLPGIDGLELCRRIRHRCTHEQTRVIALTGLSWRDADLACARAAGSDLVLFKPCLPDLLLEETKRLLEQSAQLRQASVELRARAHRATEKASELQARSTSLQDRSERRRRR